ncbi:MAG: DNA-directed RNA polymerase subunit alpha [Verrucomicrobiota bacterium JB023]|nr:DNA-directed RNA polymerase subunit alpha [Verrucomicrobiota bacterium JB023]
MSEENETVLEDEKGPVKLDRFELPNRLIKNEDTATNTYAQFVAEPFERGYGHTIGNSLRRVLLSSLEGASITSVRIAGVQHEFSTLPGVVEDVTDIILNLKRIRFEHHGKESRVLSISVNKEGEVTAGDIQDDTMYSVVNKDLVICTLDRKVKFDCEFEVSVGRGFRVADENKRPDAPIGVIAIDSIFSPVSRVKYAVEATRVGQITDYDKLVLDIWTDGRVEPHDALLQASAILRHHLDVFVNYDDDAVEFEEAPAEQSEENAALKKLLNMSVNEIELSVRAANCLNNANITSVGQLAMKSEAEMLKYRNFGKKSLNEIKDKLSDLGLSLGMSLDPSLLTGPIGGHIQAPRLGAEEDAPVGLADLIAQNIDD